MTGETDRPLANNAPIDMNQMATWARYVAVPAVPKVTSLRPLQNRKANSQHRVWVWVLKSPHHTHPEKVTKKTSWESNPYVGNYGDVSAALRTPTSQCARADVCAFWPI